MSFSAVIPARLASTRLPGKPLADIAGKPMVVRVAEQAARSRAAQVVVATDHADVMRACRAHGVTAVMTRTDHPTGTDRLAETAAALGLADQAVVVNVQGDEPLIDPALIDAVADTLAADPAAAIATASHRITSLDDFRNPNVVKVVTDANGAALYFSRAPIPFPRDAFVAADPVWPPPGCEAKRHIGIYAYRAGFLRNYAALQPAPAERAEALEQLRALHHGYRIAVVEWHGEVAAGVDTPADLERVRGLFG